MGEHLIEPYEISVWEEKLAQDGTRIEEKKIAVIGSDTMTGLNKVYNPVFHKKSNGEKTLSFSLKYKYFDPYNESLDLVNPFVNLLTNERKVKLHYGGEWYEFIVKDHTESSDEYSWDYICTDAFVLELSKNGYNLTFDSELNNNQGTAKGLAKEALKNTDWRVGEDDNVFRQLVAEPVYKATLVSVSGLTIINTDDTEETVSDNTEIYLFYSYVKNKNGKFVQFIIRDENREYTIDDKNVITDTNFRIQNELTYKDNGFYLGDDGPLTISLDEIETKYQVNRLAYNQLTTYDPVTKRIVDRFRIGDEEGNREVYRYTDYEYTTSNVLTNYIVNGDNFNMLEDGSLQGWNPYVEPPEGETINKLELVTKPELGTGKELADISLLSQIEGFLKVKFNGPLTDQYQNAVYNRGINSNAAFIKFFSKGQKYVFRWRAGVPGTVLENESEIDHLVTDTKLRLLVAKYTQDENTGYSYYYKHIDPQNIILQFDGTPKELNNKIEGGSIVNNDYIIDGVSQVPSTKYIYIDENHPENEYVWNGENGTFVERDSNNYLPYYYLVAEATKTISNTVISDPTERVGIFIYFVDRTDNSEKTYYIQDVQLTKYIRDPSKEDGTPILIGNVPEATTNPTEYYYIQPEEGLAAEDVETYATINDLKEGLGISEDITPLYNENSEKFLTISASKSNCFNILQTIAETFECWVDLQVDHDENGYITYTNGQPNKFVFLKEYAGHENWAGFKYGINLQSIERNINSDEFVTKLIVDQTQSDYVDEGFVSIASAPSNASGEAYILNFNYYYSQGLLNRDEVENDKTNFIDQVSTINSDLKEWETKRRNLEASLVELGSKRNLYNELVSTAQEMKTESLAEFEQLTKKTYEDYKAEHITLEENKQLTEEQTIYEILGSIYTTSATINSYSGLLTNIESEYWKVRKELRGSENYTIKIWTSTDSNRQRHVYLELNDYLPGFSFVIDGSSYSSTVSKKYFDIETTATVVMFTVPVGFTMETTQYTISTIEPKILKITNTENIIGVEDQIDQLLKEKEDLVNSFNKKYSRFIQEGTWSSTEYIDSELYYLDALQVSNTSAQPVVSYTINVVEISQLEGLEAYSFDTGDKTYIEDTEFFGWANVGGVLTPAREEVVVSEVEWNLDEPDQNSITVQNYKSRFEDLFQRISATVQTVQYNEATYAKTSSLIDANGTINQDVLLESLNVVSGKRYNLTSDGSVVINGDEILIRNLTDPENCVIINSNGINVSSDGGATLKIAVNGGGIIANAVTAGDIDASKIIIKDGQNESFRWDKSGISAFRTREESINRAETKTVYDLDTYVRFDQYGLYGIKENQTFKAQNLQDVIDKAHFAVTWDGFFIKNSYTGGGKVEITSENDFRVLNTVNNQLNEKVKIGALEWTQGGIVTTEPIPGVAPSKYGIRIKNNAGDVVMQTGDDGDLEITGTIYANAGEIGGMTVDDDKLTMDTIVLEPGVGIYSTVKTSNKPLFIISDVDGSAVFRNIEALGGKLSNLSITDNLIVGEANAAGLVKSFNYIPQLSGWTIKSDGIAEFNEVRIRGRVEALTGFLGNLTVNDTITVGANGAIQSSNWNQALQTGWQITDTGATFNNVAVRGHVEASTGTLGNLSVIDTITVGANGAIQSSNWSSVNNTGWKIDNTSATFNNANVRGTITALQGDFLGEVRVGPTDQNQDHIIIDGYNALIRSSNYQDGAGYGWMINKDGDAVFNNITARGAIKTAVFEYAEIQAVGGIFIFRPSSTIRSAAIVGSDLVLKVEKPFLFAKITYDEIENPSGDPHAQEWYEISQDSFTYVLTNDTEVITGKTYYNRTVTGHSWCKISNYTSDGREPNISSILATNGLTHVYEVGAVNLATKEVTLLGARAFVDAVKQSGETNADVLLALEGGALVDMGRELNNLDYDEGKHNYGIGVNSSDNTVNLPARAISLFETVIDQTKSPKVSYNYKGILGTLPMLSTTDVNDSIYNQRMAGTQGIFTNNMYIGDAGQFIAFYEDENGNKQLKIKANQIVYEVVDEEGQGTGVYHDVNQIEAEGVPGEDAVQVIIDSNTGNMFLRNNINAELTCTVYKGTTDITNQVTSFNWVKKNSDGTVDTSWSRLAAGRTITITNADVASKAIFTCTVEF